MDRRDWITIGILVVLGVVAEIALCALTLLEAPEWIEFVVLMVLFAAVLVGSYLFVITPQKQREERDTD